MTFGRAVASVTASLAVAGCAVVAVGMTHSSGSRPTSAADRLAASAAPTARPAVVPATGTPTVTAAAQVRSARPSATRTATGTVSTTVPSSTTSVLSTSVPSTPAVTSVARTTAVPTTTPVQPTPVQRAVTHAPPVVRPTTATPTPTHTVTKAVVSTPTANAAAKGGSLPLGFTTGNARKVITVVAHSHHSTTATLQAWSKAGGGWVKHGSSVTAHVGSDGLSRHASESKSATPIGSFTLTRAFGHDSNPGTSLPYSHTTPAYWWISQAGSLYNTMQICSSHCSFNQGSPNEHLYYETPFYDYAVVIDYNTRNAPGGVHQGAGSAFFLHVSVGEPTAGCVSIPKAKLVSILRWLTPSSHARILIGVR